MDSIRYSTEFITRVKGTLPNSTALHDALDKGLPDVGDMLYEECKTIIELSKLWQKEISQTIPLDQNAEQ